LKNLDKIFGEFVAFERHVNHCLDNKFDYIWAGLRLQIFENIFSQQQNIKKAHDEVDLRKKIVKLVFIFSLVKDYLISKIKIFHLCKTNNIQYAFWGVARRKKEKDGFYWDIYVDPLLECIGKNQFLVLEEKYNNIHMAPTRTNKIFYLDYMLLERVIYRVFSKQSKYSENPLECFLRIENDLNSTFDTHINLADQAMLYKNLYTFRYAQYRTLLEKIFPKLLIIVCGYGKEPLIRAAKDLHIPVVELQHGVLSKYHLGYDVSSGTKKDFADYFFSFGPAWGQMAHFPIPQERIIPIGYQYLNTAVSKLKDVSKKDQILFLSQGTIGDRLSDFAVNLLNHIPNHVNIVFKLHPGEYLRWRTEYKSLYDASEKGLITVIDGDNPPLYELMAESKWQIGVNSTALFEGMAFKCKTYIVDLPGIEYVETLINKNEFILVQKPEQIDFTYDSESLKYRTEEYFSQDTETKFKAAIDFVMKDYYA
jgi:hypothetical protein